MTVSPENKYSDLIDVIVALILPASVVALVVGVALSSGGCSGSVTGIEFESSPASPSSAATTAQNNTNPSGSADQAEDHGYASGPNEGPGFYDRPSEDQSQGGQDGEGDDPSAELTDPGCQPGEGCWGEPCAADEDCYSGVCVVDQGEGVCSMTCLNDCPSGFSCVLESPGATDPTWICASDHEKLCQPCAQSSECTSFSDVESVCVPYTEHPGLSLESTHGHFCATTCEDHEQCPSGYGCAELADQLGDLVQVCVHTDFECDCSSAALDLNLQTACTIGNDAGICSGDRVCSEAGLTACDAQEPALESCDGLDQDCDGLIDESLAPMTCGLGACEHQTASCVDGAGAICDDFLGATPESCDGIDNDCDGETDESLGAIECGEGACA
ncbi:MAG: hypothetical protein CL940_08055, partial [Deltaproteobacteria bacterium]|nr:hypothetical protein [Deltaproteobacteria bacterium]